MKTTDHSWLGNRPRHAVKDAGSPGDGSVTLSDPKHVPRRRQAAKLSTVASDKDRIDLVRRGYDELSFRYRADQEEIGHYGPWIDRLLDELHPAARILDVGCGCGVPVSRDLAAGGHTVTGIDVSERQIARARRLVPTGTFMQADITTYQLPACSFDAVVALYSIIHLPLSRQPAVLEALAGALVDGGLFLLTTGWDAWTGSESGWLGGQAEMWWSHADRDTYQRWLETAGFQVTECSFVSEGDGGHALFWARRARRPQPSQPASESDGT